MLFTENTELEKSGGVAAWNLPVSLHSILRIVLLLPGMLQNDRTLVTWYLESFMIVEMMVVKAGPPSL